jgi:uncharacterized membrane protein
MPVIEHSTVIKAPPAAVFDLISRVEDFSKYTATIKEIHTLAPNAYRWRVSLAGFELSWDVVVTEAVRPRRFSWRSTRGVENSGGFVLVPADSGTEVRFTMEYRLGNTLLEKILEPFTAPLMRKVAAELLTQVRRRLERAEAV